MTSVARLRAGLYRVTFNTDVSSCPVSATFTTAGPINGAAFDLTKGLISTGGSFANGAALTSAVDVQVADRFGTLSDIGTVDLIAFCP